MSNDDCRLKVQRDAESAAALFPALLLEAEKIAQSVSTGLHGRRHAGAGESFWQHRPYAFGDPVSSIDWRQSARANDRLYVRQNEWEAAAAAYLWRDPSRSLDYSSDKQFPTKRRRADILITALTILLSQAGERIGILGGDRRPFQGRHAPERMLEALHMPDDDNAPSAPPVSSVPTGARVVIASDFFCDLIDIKNAVRSLAGSGANGVLLQICDPAEESFPFEGRVEFLDPESRDKLTFGSAGSIADRYREAFAAHREEIKNIARGAGWTFLSHRTDKFTEAALLSLFTTLADMRKWMN